MLKQPSIGTRDTVIFLKFQDAFEPQVSAYATRLESAERPTVVLSQRPMPVQIGVTGLELSREPNCSFLVLCPDG